MSGPLSYLRKALKPSRYGRGWFFNPEKRILADIGSEDLGPHGDHDGWIGIGRNARALGIDPQTAKMIQRGVYGFYLPKNMSAEYAASVEDAPFMTRGRAHYATAFGAQYSPADDLFERLYGAPPDPGMMGGAIAQLPLARLRAWPSGKAGDPRIDVLSVTNNEITPNEFRDIWDQIGPELSVDPKTMFMLDKYDGSMVRSPLMEALTKKGRWARGGGV